MPARPRAGFVGLGLMGAPMSLRLLDAGFAVTVWNRSRDKLAPVVAQGAVAADSPAALASAVDIVLMCVTDAAAVEQVVFGGDGIVHADGTGKLLVDHSSIRPDATRAAAARLHERNGMQWVDAPVSGGVVGAAAGTLAIMCGGDPAAVDRARPLLAAYACNVTHMGPTGAGQTTKLVNQAIVGSTVAVIAEAVRFAQAAGVDAGRLTQALAGGFADSKPFQVWAPRIIDGYAEPIGTIHTILKDLDAALDLARETDSPLPVTSLARELMRVAAARGRGEDDPAALADLYRPD